MPALNHQDQLSLECSFLHQLARHFNAKPTTHAWGGGRAIPKIWEKTLKGKQFRRRLFLDTQQKKILAGYETFHRAWPKKSSLKLPNVYLDNLTWWWRSQTSHFRQGTKRSLARYPGRKAWWVISPWAVMFRSRMNKRLSNVYLPFCHACKKWETRWYALNNHKQPE